ncbi:MAG: tripartite tricarboxylate transporter substrate binding protein [Thermodesulfobacteriota bacterium]
MRKNVKRVLVVIGVIGLCVFLFQSNDLAVSKDPDYPTRPINFYYGFAAGGQGDISSRALFESAEKDLGQPFISISKPGAAGSIAVTQVINSKPDGYTLGLALISSLFVAPFSAEAEYKDLSGLTMIANFGGVQWVFVVKSDSPWKTWKEFVEWARKNPGAGKIGIIGAKSVVGTGIGLWQVEKKEKVAFTCVPFKGGNAEMVPATLRGDITAFAGAPDHIAMNYVKEGKLRILAYLGSEKVPGYENVPTFPELYGYVMPNIWGVVGPKGLPDYVLKKLDNAFAKAVKSPNFITVMNRLEVPIVYMDRAQMTKYVDENFRQLGEIMKAMKAEETKK